jgi:hypothetical protein
MKTNTIMIERLESRELFSAMPLGFAHHAAGHALAAVHVGSAKSGASTTVTVTDYAGTATNQDHRSSQITLAVTDDDGVRTGVLNVNNNGGTSTPISFNISRSGTFSFSFSMPGEKDTAAGKLSANGNTITGAWKSITTAGKKGSGKFTATRV